MRTRSLLLPLFVITLVVSVTAQSRPPLTDAHITDIARLLQLEDTRQFDAEALTALLASSHPEVRRRAVTSVGRIVNPGGLALLEPYKADANPEIVATVAFAMGQLKDPAGVPWLAQTMGAYSRNAAAAFEAARALGKVRTPESWQALGTFVTSAPDTAPARVVVGEALLSLGRFTPGEPIDPVVKWMASTDAEVRWRAAWALFRARNPAAVPHLMKMTEDPSGEVRFWAVRGLAPAQVTAHASPELTLATASARLRALVKDSDRRVRTEALRVLTAYDDDASVAVVVSALDDPDTWMSVSAAESLGRHTTRVDQIAPRLQAAMADGRPAALRTVAKQQLSRLTTPPAPPRQGGAGRGGRAPGGLVGSELEYIRTPEDYRRIVERWIVPAYNGAPRPRAVWTSEKGEFELELFAADAPLGMEELVRLTESGAIVGTMFSRVVPNFVAQQATISNAKAIASRLRDEVNRHGLTRANLAWASSGLDTGRPGYTLGNTPQPHNEGDFTSLGRVVRGMDVVDRLELGDTVTAARMVK
ncbi:MAG: HEAT repeat domain-containing protein [Vicinamibacterales bacterium]